MPNEMLPMSTWTPKDGQTYEIVDAEARERITDLEEHAGDGTVKSVNSIEPDSSGNVTLPVPSKTSDLTNDSGFITASQVPSAPVQSVNTKTGAVVLSASDVGAMPSSYVAPVTSVNGQTGDVVIQAGGGAVDSVNGKTGVVVLDAEDVGALPDDTVIPTVPQMATAQNKSDWTAGKTVDAAVLKNAVNNLVNSITDLEADIPSAVSELTNDAGYLTQHQSLAAYRTASEQDTIDAGKLDTTGNAYRSASIPMGQVDSTSTSTVFTATVPGITELRDGVCVWLKNGVVTSASGFTININGLGAKPVYGSLAAATRATTVFNASYTMLFVYNSTRVDGGCWDIVYGYDSNTTYTPPKLGFGYGTCTTAAATAAKTASISSYALTTGGIVSIKFSYDVPANATLNITSKGAKAIYHRGAAITAGVIKAGDTATFVYSTYYHLISIDRDETADLTNYQTKAITDTGGYFTTDTVDGALQEIGAELAGINTLIGTGVIT